MGCASSGSNKEDKVATGRRRLSVGNVDNAEGGAADPGTEEDRGLISQLNETDLLAMAESGEGRKMSIGSETDQGKTSFANKATKAAGEERDPTEMGLGYTCRKGLKPEAPNQDSWFVLALENKSIYAVFDGHGQKGHDVSNFVKDNLPKMLLRDQRFKKHPNAEQGDIHAMLKDNFKRCQSLVSTADRMKKLSAQMSGTTATLCIHDKSEGEAWITVAHVADSTSVLGHVTVAANGNTTTKATALTRDHKPNLKDERQRIEKAGGRVVFDGYANHRVYAKNARYPGLNMSRCMGDLMGHADCGLSAEPEVMSKKLDPTDHYLLVCSDGVWEFLSPAEGVALVHEFPSGKSMVAAEKLAKEAWDRWIKEEGGAVVDDITVLLIYLDPSKGKD